MISPPADVRYVVEFATAQPDRVYPAESSENGARVQKAVYLLGFFDSGVLTTHAGPLTGRAGLLTERAGLLTKLGPPADY